MSFRGHSCGGGGVLLLCWEALGVVFSPSRIDSVLVRIFKTKIVCAEYRLLLAFDDIVLLENTPGQAESQLYSLEKAAVDISFYLKADKTEYIGFNQNQTRDISTHAGGFLKLVD